MKDEREVTKGDWVAVVVATVVFVALSTWAGLSGGGFLEADACLHYQYARFVWGEPYRLIDVWGRPVCTGLYAVPALLGGRAGVHVMSCAVAVGMAWVVRRIAQLQGYRWAGLAFVFVLAQPLVFLHSFSELTELPFALLVAVGFLAYRERRWWELALVAGVMPLARPEGFGFLILVAGGLVLHRRWWWVLLLPVPILVWSYGGWVRGGMYGEWWRWLPANWPYAAESLYQPGPIWHFVGALPAVVGPIVFPAMVIGIWVGVRWGWEGLKEWGVFELPHRERCEWLIVGIPVMVLAGHSYLYWRGKMASNGELRYLLVVAPFWGLLCARGWAWVWERFNWGHVYRWAGVAAVLPVWVNVPRVGYPVVPLVVMEDWKEGGVIANWYEGSGIKEKYPWLVNSHPGVTYAMDISPTDEGRTRPWTKKTVREAKPGAVLIWDPVYGIYNADAERSISVREILAAGWVPIEGPAGVGRSWAEWRFFVSPRAVDGTESRAGGEVGDDRKGADCGKFEGRNSNDE